MNIKQYFLLALKSIRTSKLRSFLTMLGIIIGVASVIVLVSIMNSFSGEMSSTFESFGAHLITVNIFGRSSNRTVSAEDLYEWVDAYPDQLRFVSPFIASPVTVKNGTKSLTTTLNGTGEDYDKIRNKEVENGRFLGYIDMERRQKVCVIGSYVATELFGADDPVGRQVRLGGDIFNVVGVLKETGGGLQGGDDDCVFIPYTLALRMFRQMSGVYYLSASDGNQVDSAAALLRSKLYQVYQSDDAYRVASMNEMLTQVNELLGMMSSILVGIAAISLLVGGIGIMNIMLVSVTERTREIGIRKSLGAKRRDIRGQFIIEAAVTSALGGTLGILLGITGAYLVGRLLGFTVVPTPTAILMAFSVSAGIGILFGYFPASKASKLNPIDALRYE
ncbi:MAG: ABC transporter permease [Oscillospiraceae bacterium]|jgi:putative ABC transport system permease protein|nr:ABC transporter permease [Oscillospiraceae bacterium]